MDDFRHTGRGSLCQEGITQYIKENYSRAFEYLTKAAELGDTRGHFRLACLYQEGKGVQKDVGKMIYHFEEAAIAGHPDARYLLGEHEYENGNMDRAVKHLIISANQGHDASMKTLMDFFKQRFVSKDDLAVALRAHKAAVDATKSSQRELEEIITSVNPR